jgi:hypothetical protein
MDAYDLGLMMIVIPIVHGDIFLVSQSQYVPIYPASQPNETVNLNRVWFGCDAGARNVLVKQNHIILGIIN